MTHTYDEICNGLNIFSGSIYIKKTTAFFFISFFNEGLSIIRCNSWNLQLLISRRSNTTLLVGGELLLSNVTFVVMLQTLAVKSFLNKGCFRFLRRMSKSKTSKWDMGQRSTSQCSGQSRKHEPAHCFKWVHIIMTNKPFYISFP